MPQLERLAIRAVRASRRDSALARMLPVFFWRIRTCISIAELVREAQEQGAATATGFFLEMASQLGGSAVFDAALTALRPGVTSRPAYFFQGTASRPFERLAADLNTTPEARRWGWLMNMPRDSFESYFRKVAAL